MLTDLNEQGFLSFLLLLVFVMAFNQSTGLISNSNASFLSSSRMAIQSEQASLIQFSLEKSFDNQIENSIKKNSLITLNSVDLENLVSKDLIGLIEKTENENSKVKFFIANHLAPTYFDYSKKPSIYDLIAIQAIRIEPIENFCIIHYSIILPSDNKSLHALISFNDYSQIFYLPPGYSKTLEVPCL